MIKRLTILLILCFLSTSLTAGQTIFGGLNSTNTWTAEQDFYNIKVDTISANQNSVIKFASPFLGEYQGTISTATYSYNSDKLDDYDSSQFPQIKDINGNIKQNAYFISGSTTVPSNGERTINLPVNKINIVFIQPYGDTPINMDEFSLYRVYTTSFTIRNDESVDHTVFWQAEVE